MIDTTTPKEHTAMSDHNAAFPQMREAFLTTAQACGLQIARRLGYDCLSESGKFRDWGVMVETLTDHGTLKMTLVTDQANQPRIAGGLLDEDGHVLWSMNYTENSVKNVEHMRSMMGHMRDAAVYHLSVLKPPVVNLVNEETQASETPKVKFTPLGQLMQSPKDETTPGEKEPAKTTEVEPGEKKEEPAQPPEDEMSPEDLVAASGPIAPKIGADKRESIDAWSASRARAIDLLAAKRARVSSSGAWPSYLPEGTMVKVMGRHGIWLEVSADSLDFPLLVDESLLDEAGGPKAPRVIPRTHTQIITKIFAQAPSVTVYSAENHFVGQTCSTLMAKKAFEENPEAVLTDEGKDNYTVSVSKRLWYKFRTTAQQAPPGEKTEA